MTVILPPEGLMFRVGESPESADVAADYERTGALSRQSILDLLPAGWTFEGKRVLDFGCGAGRTLRHFLPEAEAAERFVGCDVDELAISWAQQHLSPPFEFLKNDWRPPLAYPGPTFDLIYAMSVFTHLYETWAEWLLELHRICRPDGLVVATFIGEPAARQLGLPYPDGRVGIQGFGVGSQAYGGFPDVIHSPWWLQEHWGRLFEILEIRESGVASGDPGGGHGGVVMRRREASLTVADLERPGADAREGASLAWSAMILSEDLGAARRESAALRYELVTAQNELAMVYASRSWRVTAPLRRLRSARNR